jgi:hypothetical protein
MTLEDLKKTPAADLSANSWLREVCLQLAQLNEKKPPEIEPERVKRAYNKRTA